MFLEPNFDAIENYVLEFWPEISAKDLKSLVSYVKKGVGIYHKNIVEATEVATMFLKKERPFAKDNYLEIAAPKIAQEQLRMFIPIIFPTGFDYTINLTVLAAMYRTAWTPAMRRVVSEMVRLVTQKFPGISFMFQEKAGATKKNDWAVTMPKKSSLRAKFKPIHKLLEILGEEKFIPPSPGVTYPVDLLHFEPRMMNNSVGEIKTAVEISVATMGQDQRHRTLRRGEPVFTGAFYLPPILNQIKLGGEAKILMENWVELSSKIPNTLAMLMAPYGAMVTYEKSGSFNALIHEQGKRLCWCAQEEIYHAGLALGKAIEKRNKLSKLLSIFEPPCYRTKKCVEGARYCGRDLKKTQVSQYFSKRNV